MKTQKIAVYLALLTIVTISFVAPVLGAEYVEDEREAYLPPQSGDYENYYPLWIKVNVNRADLLGFIASDVNVYIRKQGGPTYFNDALAAGQSTSWYHPDGAMTMCDFFNPSSYNLLFNADVCMYVD